MPDESLEVKIARIDENMIQVKAIVPLVQKHDQEILIAKVVVTIVLILIALTHPTVADVFARIMP